MITVATQKPIAVDTVDHLHPRGTKNDNSTSPAFNAKLFAVRPASEWRVLDLGCSGGGFVRSIIDAGGYAVGIEGSDWSARQQRAEWATIPAHLHLADITEPFAVFDDGEPVRFNLVTAWEVFEHIPRERLPMLLENIRRHLDGLLIVSISMVYDLYEGVEYHATVESEAWWLEYMRVAGFEERRDLRRHFDQDWVRGPINSLCTVFECRPGG